MENIKPIAKVTGRDGNVFIMLGICTKTLRQAGEKDKAKELSNRVFASSSYANALLIMSEYCELI